MCVCVHVCVWRCECDCAGVCEGVVVIALVRSVCETALMDGVHVCWTWVGMELCR